MSLLHIIYSSCGGLNIHSLTLTSTDVASLSNQCLEFIASKTETRDKI